MITIRPRSKDRKNHARLCNGRVDILEFQFIFRDEPSKGANQIYSDYQKLFF